MCSRYYHDLTLTPDCQEGNFLFCQRVPRQCSQHNAVYNIINYLVDTRFLPPNVSILKWYRYVCSHLNGGQTSWSSSHIPEVMHSNLDPDWGFSWFTRVPQGKYHDSTPNYATTASFLVLSNSLFTSFCTIWCCIVWAVAIVSRYINKVMVLNGNALALYSEGISHIVLMLTMSSNNQPIRGIWFKFSLGYYYFFLRYFHVVLVL
jgi:hypothetical protein